MLSCCRGGRRSWVWRLLPPPWLVQLGAEVQSTHSTSRRSTVPRVVALALHAGVVSAAAQQDGVLRQDAELIEVLGVLLVFAGLELCPLLKSLKTNEEYFIALLIAGIALVVADIAKLDPDPGIFRGEAKRLLQGGRGRVELAEHPLRLAFQGQGMGCRVVAVGDLEGLIAKRDAGLEILAAVVAGLGLGFGGDQGGKNEEEGAHGGLRDGYG